MAIGMTVIIAWENGRKAGEEKGGEKDCGVVSTTVLVGAWQRRRDGDWSWDEGR